MLSGEAELFCFLIFLENVLTKRRTYGNIDNALNDGVCGAHCGEVSEWFKEPVLKTGDPQGPWVRIPPSPPFKTSHFDMDFALEKYSRGRRGAPAKGVGRETGARVQIPPSPPGPADRFFCQPVFFSVKKPQTGEWIDEPLYNAKKKVVRN